MARTRSRIVEVSRYLETDDGAGIDLLVRVSLDGQSTEPYFDATWGNWLPGDSIDASVQEVVEDAPGFPPRPDLLALYENDIGVIDDALVADADEQESRRYDADECSRERWERD